MNMPDIHIHCTEYGLADGESQRSNISKINEGA